MPELAPAVLPVTVLTGFLGAGKTTLLNRLLKQPGWARTAVLINEFGAVGVDHLLVERIHEQINEQVDENIVLLSAGCVCCSIRSDLSQALRDLFFRRGQGLIPAFERVVIETTGLADPAPILHTLLDDPLLQAVYRLDGVITVVDLSHALVHLQHFENVKQVALADVLVLGKFEGLDAPLVERLRDRLHRLNPGARMIDVPAQGAEAALLGRALINLGLYDASKKTLDARRWLQDEAVKAQSAAVVDHPHDPDRHGASITSFCLEFDEALDWDEVRQALEMVLSVAGDRVLRIKGVLDVAAELSDRRALVIHAVQHHLYPVEELPHWPIDWPRHSRLVFIVRDLEPGYVRQAFEYFVKAPVMDATKQEFFQ